MSNHKVITIGAMLGIALLVGTALSALGAGYVLTYNDAQEYPARPNADIKSLRSYQSGSEIIIELEVYGTISSESGYVYSIIAGDNDVYSVTAGYTSGYFYGAYSTPSTSGSFSTYTVSGDTLSIIFPSTYAGPEAEFDIAAVAAYSTDAVHDTDTAGGEKWASGGGGGGGDSGDFHPGTPASVPWTVGATWSSGGYIDVSALAEDLKQNLTQTAPSGISVSVNAVGGIGQYVTIEYKGEDSGMYKFDYTGRIYASVEGNMHVSGTAQGTTGTMSANLDLFLDFQYSGSIWLEYYEDGAGSAYYAVSKMTVTVDGTMNVNMDMSMDVSGGLQERHDSMEIAGSGSADMNLTLDCDLGIPFLPAEDEDIYVYQVVTCAYSGHATANIDMDVTTTGNFSGMPTPMEDIHESIDQDISGSFSDFFSLSYDAGTNTATAPPIITGFYGLLMNIEDFPSLPGTRYSYGFETQAVYDPDTGFYESYSPYLGELGDVGYMPVPIDPTSAAEDFQLGKVPEEDAQSFQENPEAYLSSEGVMMPGAAPKDSTWLYILITVVVVIVVVLVVVGMVMMRKKAVPHGPQPYEMPPPPPQYPPQQPQPPPPQEPWQPPQPPQYPPTG
ncbi:MAG: hypothetical protein AB1665_00550 [Candidatus Thermoplasmatota archaeon]